MGKIGMNSDAHQVHDRLEAVAEDVMISGSRGKGSRRMPGRDGGSRRGKRGKLWRDFVPSAVHLEVSLEQPTLALRFRIDTRSIEGTLGELDSRLANQGVPFHIRSLGSSKQFFGILRSSRFELRVSERHADLAKSVLHELDAA